MKTFNKRGDKGETSLLLHGVRVSKTDPRCEAYGTIDEAVSALGMGRALSSKERVKEILLDLQKELFTLGGELATPTEHYAEFCEKFTVISESMVDRLESLIDELEQGLEMPRAFILPGDTAASAAIDLGRAIIRRAERRIVDLREAGLVQNEELHRYVNRMADLLFTLARYEAADIGEG
jgi:cob(I)alamin adenosyltransferase